MVRNLDPKPGRWILPLVIVGMVAFTYFFVQALEGSTDIEPITTTSSTTTSTTLENTTTTLTPELSAYLDALDAAEAQMTSFQTEMATVNGGFDADPRTVEFPEADSRLEALAAEVQSLVATLNAVVVPVGSEAVASQHAVLVAAAGDAAVAAADVVAGLRSTDTGAARQNALAAFDAAVASFNQALDSIREILAA